MQQPACSPQAYIGKRTGDKTRIHWRRCDTIGKGSRSPKRASYSQKGFVFPKGLRIPKKAFLILRRLRIHKKAFCFFHEYEGLFFRPLDPPCIQLAKSTAPKVVPALHKDAASRKQIVKKVSKLVSKGKILPNVVLKAKRQKLSPVLGFAACRRSNSQWTPCTALSS